MKQPVRDEKSHDASPPQGNSIKELGGYNGETNMFVLKVDEQPAMLTPGRPEPLHKGYGGRREPGKDDLIGPAPNRSSHGKRRREEVGSESERMNSHCRLEQLSFWEKTLTPACATLSGTGRRGDTIHGEEYQPRIDVSDSVEGEMETDDIGWNTSQENVDLATAEADTHKRGKFGVNDKTSLSWIHEALKGSNVDPALQRARRRNAIRLLKANESDLNILSKYLPSDIAAFFPFEIEGPEDYYNVKASWLGELLEVAKSRCDTPLAPCVRLGTAPLDLDHNTSYLESCDWDFEKLFERHANTTVDHGSEFRPVSELERFLGGHPHFKILSTMFSNGFDYYLNRGPLKRKKNVERI